MPLRCETAKTVLLRSALERNARWQGFRRPITDVLRDLVTEHHFSLQAFAGTFFG